MINIEVENILIGYGKKLYKNANNKFCFIYSPKTKMMIEMFTKKHSSLYYIVFSPLVCYTSDHLF